MIPPTSPPHTHTGEALSVLQHRLASVEDDAKDLVNQLAKMGFHGTGDGRDNDMPKDPAFLTVCKLYFIYRSTRQEATENRFELNAV